MAVKRTKGSVIALINNDIEVIAQDWLMEMVKIANRRDVGAVGAKLLYSDDTVQHAGIVVERAVIDHVLRGISRVDSGPWDIARLPQEFSAVTGACLVMRREIYEQVDGMNEILAVEFNDIDLCLKVRRAGYRIIWTPRAELYHWESASRGSAPRESEDRRRFDEQWGQSDSINTTTPICLALNHQLAFPPRVIWPWRQAPDSGSRLPASNP